MRRNLTSQVQPLIFRAGVTASVTKGIVKIKFSKTRPRTSWEQAAPNEYGFYANVNPNVAHPRWSQARERRIGAGGGGFQSIFNSEKQDTLMFNGYGEHVAHLYDGLNLRRNF